MRPNLKDCPSRAVLIANLKQIAGGEKAWAERVAKELQQISEDIKMSGPELAEAGATAENVLGQAREHMIELRLQLDRVLADYLRCSSSSSRAIHKGRPRGR